MDSGGASDEEVPSPGGNTLRAWVGACAERGCPSERADVSVNCPVPSADCIQHS